MTRWRWALLGLAVGALVWALGGEWATIHSNVRENHFLDAVVGLSFFAGGIVALDRRPGNALGPLMIAYAFTWFVGNWAELGIPVFPSLVFVTGLMQAPILAHIALAYASGRLRTTFDRFVLRAFYGTAVVISIAGVVTFPRRRPGCGYPWTPLLFPNRAIFDAVGSISDHTAVVLVPLFLSAIALRWRRASRAERRDLTPLWVAATILAIVFLVGAFVSPDTNQPFPYLLWELRAVLEIGAPIIFVWGVLSTRLARSAVGDLVVELERPGPPVDLEAALARALGDRSLEVTYALDGEDRWVDADGLPVSLPVPGDPRAVTLVERDGVPLAALIHDPALDEGLVGAAGAAAGMAIANEQLRAEVRAQLEEVRASRQRIVEAGDRERRRVERNLHDGAQQRLVTLSLALAMLRERTNGDPATSARRCVGRAEACDRRAPRAGARDPPGAPDRGGAPRGRRVARGPIVATGPGPCGARRQAPRAGRGHRILRRQRGPGQRGQVRERVRGRRRDLGPERVPPRRGPRRRQGRRRCAPGLRAQGARRPRLRRGRHAPSRQSARQGNSGPGGDPTGWVSGRRA